MKSAGFWERALAALTDFFLVKLLFVGILAAGLKFSVPTPAVVWIFWPVATLLCTFVLLVEGKGQTPGATIFKIHVTKADGSPLSFIHAFLRSLVFIFWASSPRVVEAVGFFWAPAGLLIFGQLIQGIFISFCLCVFLVMNFDGERKSPLDTFSGTRTLADQTPEAEFVPTPPAPARVLRRATAALLYCLLAVVATAAIEKVNERRNDFQGSVNNLQLLAVLKWAHAETPLLSPRVEAIMAYPDNFNHTDNPKDLVPTLRLTGWVPPVLVQIADQRDRAATEIQEKFGNLPTLRAGFQQIEVKMDSDVNAIPLIGRQSISRFMPLTPEPDSSQRVANYTVPAGVLTRYTTIEAVPKDLHERLYVKRDFKGVAAILLPLERQPDELGARHFLDHFDELAFSKNDADFFSQKQVLNEWVKKDPRSALPYLLRGRLEQDHAWQLRGADFAAYVDKTRWHGFFDLTAKADDDYKMASDLEPKNPFPWLERIETQRTLEKGHDEEESVYRQTMRLAPWMGEAREMYMHGLAPQWGGSAELMQKFAADCEKAAEKYPLSGFAEFEAAEMTEKDINDRAKLYGSPRVWPVIERVYKRILAKYPKEVRFMSSYAWYADTAQKYSIAAALFERIGDRFYQSYWGDLDNYNTQRSQAYDQAGWVFLQKNQLDKGMPWLIKAVDVNLAYAWPMAKLATCYERKKDVANAKKWAEQAMAANPDSLDKAEAQETLTWVKAQQK